METAFNRLKHIAEWSKTSERREVNIRKEDLYWAVSALTLLSEMLDGDLDDMDLNEPLTQPADLSNEETPL